jgi:hypothetical protein
MRIVMKSLFVLVSALLFSFAVYGQEVKVPEEVKSSFDKLYPGASDVKWEKEKHNKYDADFKDGGKNISVVFENDGNLKETKRSIPVTELPKTIAPCIQDEYEGFNITGAYKIIDDKAEVTFQAEITKDKERTILIFDQDGQFVSEKKMKQDKNKISDDEKED